MGLRSGVRQACIQLRRIPPAFKLMIVLILMLILVVSEHGYSQRQHGIGLILSGSRYADGWYGANYDAALRACSDSDFELLTADNVGEEIGSLMAACDNLLRMGAELIVLTGLEDPRRFLPYMRSHPNVQFSGFDLTVRAPNYRPVFFRLYQARYLAGMLAAYQSKAGILGYVAAKPTVEIIRGINAFTLGARSVNPKAKVRVIWTQAWSDEATETEAVRSLKRGGVDLITYHQNEEFVPRSADKLRLDFIGMSMPLSGYSNHALSSVVCDWDTFYRLLLRSFDDESYVPPLWPGIDSGAVGLAVFSQRVPKSVAAELAKARHELEDGSRTVFSGVITDLAGQEHDFGSGKEGSADCAEPENTKLLYQMNYLVAGVETIND